MSWKGEGGEWFYVKRERFTPKTSHSELFRPGKNPIDVLPGPSTLPEDYMKEVYANVLGKYGLKYLKKYINKRIKQISKKPSYETDRPRKN